MNQFSMSRRALIGGASVAAVALAAPWPVDATPDAFPADWHTLIANYRRLNADAKAVGIRFGKAERAYYAQRKPEPAKQSGPSPINEHMTIAQIKAMPAELFQDDGADWRAWRAEADAAHARIVGPASDAWNAALRDEGDAMRAIQAYPATSPAMVVEKLRLLGEHAGDAVGSDPDDLVGVMADVRRLSGGEA